MAEKDPKELQLFFSPFFFFDGMTLPQAGQRVCEAQPSIHRQD